MIKQLILKHSISRAKDSYGYNRVTLTDTTTCKKYACVGGGYDMTGTVFGEWLQDNYQAELLAIAHKAHYIHDGHRLTKAIEWQPMHQYVKLDCHGSLYGMTYHIVGDRVALDGACGLECMLDIAKQAGLSVQRQVDSKGHLIGFFV